MPGARSLQGNLIVVARRSGPLYYGKWRDARQQQVKRRIGPAWLAPARDGGWTKRRGRCPDDHFDERAAQVALQALIDDHEAALTREGVAGHQRAGRSRPGVSSGLTVGELGDAWLQWGVQEREWKRSTHMDYRDAVRKLSRSLGGRRASSVTHGDLVVFLERLVPERNGQTLTSPPSARMRTKYRQVLRSMFGYGAETGLLDRNPAAALPIARRRRKSMNHPLRREEYFTPEEVWAVHREAAKVSQFDGVLVLTLAFAGLRLGEALALRWRDVDFERSMVVVSENWTRGQTTTPKSGGGRTVPMAPELAHDLARLETSRIAWLPHDLVFHGPEGGHIDPNRFRSRYYDAQERADVRPRRTVHQLRHTFATVCASAGIPLRTIQGWCGHEDHSTTERYAHFLPRQHDAELVSAAFRLTAPDARVMAPR